MYIFIPSVWYINWVYLLFDTAKLRIIEMKYEYEIISDITHFHNIYVLKQFVDLISIIRVIFNSGIAFVQILVYTKFEDYSL